MVRTMVGVMASWESIIDALGGTGAVAETLSQSDSTVSGWKTRGIPAPHWSAVVALATLARRPEITFEVLATLAARKFVAADEARA